MQFHMVADILVIALMYHVVDSGDSGDFLFDRVERADIMIPPRRQRVRPRFPFPSQQFPLPPIGNLPDFGPPNPVTDPADISHMLGQCSMGNSVNMASVFQGMFVPNSKVNGLVREAKTNLRNSNSRNENSNSKSSKYSFIESNRISKIIGQANSGSNSGSNGNCCDTEMRMTAPFTVLEGGKRMQVVHMNSSYQFVHEGVCVKPRAKCRDYGECVQIYKYSYMLLYDPSMINMYPPVRFGRVQIKSHCECMNIGA